MRGNVAVAGGMSRLACMSRSSPRPAPEIDRPLAEALARVRDGTHHDPFSVLGPHDGPAGRTVRAFQPDAVQLRCLQDGREAAYLQPVAGVPGAFVGPLPGNGPYRLEARYTDGATWVHDDPYRFGPVLGDIDEYLIGEGTHYRLWDALGAHVMAHEGVPGTHFAVWAPNARRVSVVGHFNAWDGRRHPMRRRGATGVWEIFLPGIAPGEIYKYEILGAYGHVQPLKADPVGFAAEVPPETASVVNGMVRYEWTDEGWMAARPANQRSAPISIYEVHLGSWRRGLGGETLDYATLAD